MRKTMPYSVAILQLYDETNTQENNTQEKR